MAKSLSLALPGTFDSGTLGRSLPPQVPDQWDAGYPFDVSYKLMKRSGVITLQMTAPRQWVKGLLAALGLLTYLARDLERMAARGESERTVRAQNSAWQKKQAAISRAYDAYRKRGLLHREAVRALVTDPRFNDLNFNFPMFNRVIPSPAELKRQGKLQTARQQQVIADFQSMRLPDQKRLLKLLTNPQGEKQNG